MKVNNQIEFSEQQMQALIAPGHNKPIYMVNLLKFKDKAEYPDGRVTDITGAQAFAIYGEAVGRILMGMGGGPMFSGRVEGLVLGKVEELWDAVVIAMYPNKRAMYDMLASTEYQEIAIHRTAGLAGQLNIETTEPSGLWFIQQAAS